MRLKTSLKRIKSSALSCQRKYMNNLAFNFQACDVVPIRKNCYTKAFNLKLTKIAQEKKKKMRSFSLSLASSFKLHLTNYEFFFHFFPSTQVNLGHQVTFNVQKINFSFILKGIFRHLITLLDMPKVILTNFSNLQRQLPYWIFVIFWLGEKSQIL